MSAEKFHELAIKYKYSDARKKREIVNELNEKADKRLKESMDASEELAKQYDLKGNQDRTRAYFRDPFNTFNNRSCYFSRTYKTNFGVTCHNNLFSFSPSTSWRGLG